MTEKLPLVEMRGTIATLASLVLATLVAQPVLAAPAGDEEITHAVDEEIFQDPVVPYDMIDVETDAGVVTLTGRLSSLLAKERAVRISENVKGVRAVINRLEVVPYRAPSAEKLRSDVREALRFDAAVDAAAIAVDASEAGKVTLTGTAPSYQERSLARTVAASVDGVTEVENRITIEYVEDRGDPDIRQEIARRLHWDALVDAAGIAVTVADGHVRLTGAVSSAAERTRAVKDAWTAGVRSVDATGLEVDPWAQDEDVRAETVAVRSDAEIREAVKDALLFDPRVLSANVDPKVSAGVVTLYGTAENLKAKQVAAADARNVVGVVRVKNRLKVRPIADLSDEEIAVNIDRALARDPFLADDAVSVVVSKDGRAHLIGTVDTYFEKGQAEDLVYRTAGVVSVRNSLRVEQPARLSHDPYVDEWRVYDYSWYTPEQTYWYTKTDWEIEQDISDELFWSPFVDANQVEVAVDDGVASLSGVVDSYREFDAAAENALEGGAITVRNELQVR